MSGINNRLIVLVALLFNSGFVFSQDNIWKDSSLSAKSSDQFAFTRYFDADDQSLRSKLSLVPNEVQGTSDIIELPMPDGSLGKFSIVESSIMEDGLAEQFPQIKSYKVYGIDDPTASGRVDMSPKGFRGMLMTSYGRVFIDPANNASHANRYTSSLRSGNRGHSDQPFQCDVHALPENDKAEVVNFSRNESVNRTPGSLITYRLAVSATSEYVTVVGGTLDLAMAEINTAINRVNQVYERDLGIRLFLVSNNSLIIELPGTNVGFTNSDGLALLVENQTRIDNVIGTANYDIGHVFSTGGGGVASIQSVCSTARKGRGVTGLNNPTGDGFYIDYVAHEIGHQFGGNHTFNASTGSCFGSNRNASTAFEPGSGSTILGYAGICGAENIATASDATFHAGTISEINTFVSTGGGGICAAAFVITPANSDPTSVDAGVDRTIPSRTAFRLTGSAVDVGDTLTYQWDQMNAGTATSAGTIGQDLGDNALFRSHIPQPTGVRNFPSLGTQVNGTTTLLARGETLPTTARTLDFRLTVRDGRSGQGTDDMTVAIVATGPFTVTSPDLAGNITANTIVPVTWDVAGTTAAPVSCSNVDIELFTFSTDGTTYAVTDLLSPTPNDGAQNVTIPNMNNPNARISVSCSDNIFYDISNGDQNITGGASAFATTGNSTNTSTVANYTTITTTGGPSTTPTTSSGGGGVLDKVLISFLFSIFLVVLLSGSYGQQKMLRLLIGK